jgi:hypothetical protein
VAALETKSIEVKAGAMKVLFSGEVEVDYGQIFVESESADDPIDLWGAFAGQEGVGLCGSGRNGTLLLLTGLQNGGVGLTAELHDSRPALDEMWEDIVEVPFRPGSQETRLRQWNGKGWWELGLSVVDYRVRYSATDMDAAFGLNNRDDDEPQTDRYLLQFWPAPPESARVLKQTSRQAAKWHAFATPPLG